MDIFCVFPRETYDITLWLGSWLLKTLVSNVLPVYIKFILQLRIQLFTALNCVSSSISSLSSNVVTYRKRPWWHYCSNLACVSVCGQTSPHTWPNFTCTGCLRVNAKSFVPTDPLMLGLMCAGRYCRRSRWAPWTVTTLFNRHSVSTGCLVYTMKARRPHCSAWLPSYSNVTIRWWLLWADERVLLTVTTFV